MPKNFGMSPSTPGEYAHLGKFSTPSFENPSSASSQKESRLHLAAIGKMGKRIHVGMTKTVIVNLEYISSSLGMASPGPYRTIRLPQK
ncbi:MAG: hypothetical protein CM1200mP9_10630 [Gammaproteobacteria bacterium]|nr:MAG: hypothetical protein CM1200mP9_10630 [Gammaproteobacteria bacterium]